MLSKKNLNLKSGDILAVPTTYKGKIGYVLARVIENKQSALLEVFDKFYDDFDINGTFIRSLPKKNFKVSDRLFQPIFLIPLFASNRGEDKWKVLANSETLNASVSKEGVCFLYPIYYENGNYLNLIDGELYDELGNRNRVAEKTTHWQPWQVIFRVQFYMDNIYNKGDVFDVIEVSGTFQNKGILLDRIKEITHLSILIANNFEQA